MVRLSVALLIIGIVALPVSLGLYHAVKMPRNRHRLNVALTVVAATVAVLVNAGAGGWLLTLSIGLLAISALLLISAWAWKFDRFVQRATDRGLRERPDLREKAATNPILRMLMRRLGR